MAKRPAGAKPPRKIGRPTKRTQELVDQICRRLSEGEPLAQICRDENMPNPSTVRDWANGDETVSRAIARARELGFDAIAEECLEIADDGRNDWMDQQAEEGDELALKFNGEHVQRSKLRVETRLKLLAKWDPKRYGERLALDHGVQDNLAEKLRAARERAAGKDS